MKKLFLTSIVLGSAFLTGCGTTNSLTAVPVTAPSQTVSQPAPRASSSVMAQDVSTMNADKFTTITFKNFVVGGNRLAIIHRCQGVVNSVAVEGAAFYNVTYCVGRNQLVIVGNNGEEKVLEDRAATSAADAPVLLDERLLLSASSSPRVLISYAPEPCSTSNDCGVGLATNFVTYAVDMQTAEARSLKNYPTNGNPIWNPSKTKAVFMNPSCGGGGCSEQLLVLYDLQLDSEKNIGTEKAAYDNGNVDLSNASVSQWWEYVTWKNDNALTAYVEQKSKKTKNFEITF